MFVPTISTSKAEIEICRLSTKICSSTLRARSMASSSSTRFHVFIRPADTSYYRQQNITNLYLKHAQASFVASIPAIPTIAHTTTKTHPRLLFSILLHLIQHAIIVCMVVSGGHHHNILLGKSIPESTVKNGCRRCLLPTTNNRIRHSAILC